MIPSRYPLFADTVTIIGLGLPIDRDTVPAAFPASLIDEQYKAATTNALTLAIKCSRCAKMVLMSPSTLTDFERDGATAIIICLKCVLGPYAHK